MRRIGERYVIYNQTYGMAAFDVNGVRTVVYMGMDRMPENPRNESRPSVVEVVDPGDDAPSSLRATRDDSRDRRPCYMSAECVGMVYGGRSMGRSGNALTIDLRQSRKDAGNSWRQKP